MSTNLKGEIVFSSPHHPFQSLGFLNLILEQMNRVKRNKRALLIKKEEICLNYCQSEDLMRALHSESEQ